MELYRGDIKKVDHLTCDYGGITVRTKFEKRDALLQKNNDATYTDVETGKVYRGTIFDQEYKGDILAQLHVGLLFVESNCLKPVSEEKENQGYVYQKKA